MKLTGVTITGADDNTNINELYHITHTYPFVEWGILIGSRTGIPNIPRMPTYLWIAKLADLSLPIAIHLCGTPLGQLLAQGVVPDIIARSPSGTSRCQFNWHNHSAPSQAFYDILLNPDLSLYMSWIFKFTEKTADYIPQAIARGVKKDKIEVFFDSSHGQGLLPEKYQPPLADFHCGYAGGLSPDNLQEELARLAAVVGDNNVWIDLETNVRTDDKLDIKKVIKVLEIAKPWIA